MWLVELAMRCRAAWHSVAGISEPMCLYRTSIQEFSDSVIRTPLLFTLLQNYSERALTRVHCACEP